MDLHEVFMALRAGGFKAGEITFDYGAPACGDQPLHACGCGYTTELVEVMAIHQVRAHNWPFGDARALLFQLPRVMAVAPGARMVECYEADDPSGPWTPCVDGIVRKRYAQMRE